MKKLAFVVAVVMGAFGLQSSAPAATSPARVIVKVRDGSFAAQAVTKGTGGHEVAKVDAQTSVVEVPNVSVADAVALFKAQDHVEYAEPDTEYHASVVPNDPCFLATCASSTSQANLAKIGMPTAWNVNKGAPSMLVGVIDSGVDVGHPDLAGHVVVGPDFTSDNSTDDLYGHGTHVAGIIGAATDNGVGVAGVVWNSSMLSIKVLNSSGVGSASSIAKGIRYGADAGVRIENLSLGAASFSQTLADAVSYAESRGVLVVAAADNASSNTQSYPAALPGVVAVGASTSDDKLASFSNYGPWVDLLAPGTGILSTWPRALKPTNPYATDDGTSMSAPHVAGVAALLWSARPSMTAMGIERRLFSTTDTIEGQGTVSANGRLSAARALSDLPTGYRAIASDGGVFNYGVPFLGSMGGKRLNKPIVTGMTTGDENGYSLVASDGGVFCFGNAQFHGSTGAMRLNKPIVSSASTVSGSGYWLAASDGGVFSFGDAPFYGSTGSIPLNKPIVAMVPTATGRGYWLIASDGGVFSYGDAKFYGSTGGMSLNQPIVSAARTSDGLGYWLTAADGGIFAFGDATFYGSTGAQSLKSPIVSIAASSAGAGYWMTAADGGVFAFGDAPFLGSTGGQKLNAPIVIGIS